MNLNLNAVVQQQQQQQNLPEEEEEEEDRIWQWEWCKYIPTFKFKIKRNGYDQYNRYSTSHDDQKYTIEEVLRQNRHKLHNATEIMILGDEYTFKPFRGPTISDCIALGTACQHFENLKKVFLMGIWNDEQVCTFLRHVQNPKQIDGLHISFKNDCPEKKVATIQELKGFTSLKSLVLSGIRLDDNDCSALGHTIATLQGLTYFNLGHISLPSCESYPKLIDAMQSNIPKETHIGCNLLTDERIVLRQDAPEDHQYFYKAFKKYKDKNVCGAFRYASRDHLCYYGPLNRAGRLRFLSDPKLDTSVLREWVEALAHEEVRDWTSTIYHFLRMRPDIYAGAALEAIEKEK